MGILGKIKKFGDFGNKYSKFSDSGLIKAFQNGDKNALAEYANRYSDDFDYKASMTSPGDAWLKYHKWASEFDPSKGISPREWLWKKTQWDLNDIQRNKTQLKKGNEVLESELDESPIDAMIANTEAEDRASDMMEGYNLLRRNVNDDESNKILDAMEKSVAKQEERWPAEWEKYNRWATHGDDSKVWGGAAQSVAPSNLGPSMSEVAEETGIKRPLIYYKNSNMIKRLPQNIQNELREILKGE